MNKIQGGAVSQLSGLQRCLLSAGVPWTSCPWEPPGPCSNASSDSTSPSGAWEPASLTSSQVTPVLVKRQLYTARLFHHYISKLSFSSVLGAWAHYHHHFAGKFQGKWAQPHNSYWLQNRTLWRASSKAKQKLTVGCFFTLHLMDFSSINWNNYLPDYFLS